MLVVQNLRKRFGEKEVVRGLSFTVEKGESFGLLGPNGAGKSTTISMISGLVSPTAGEIRVAGFNVREQAMQVRQIMGIVPQDIALYPTLSARENLLFFGQMFGLFGRELHSRVDEALEIVSLTDRQKDRVQTYSGGMKRRVNIAASLLHRPQLLIMDEPTVGIDPQSRNNILETVRRLNLEMGMTLVYTSHYMEEVEFLCERVGIIDHGQLIGLGSLDEVRRVAGSETTIRLRVTEPDQALLTAIIRLPGIATAWLDEGALIAQVIDAGESLPPMLGAVTAANKRVLGVEVQEPNLESVFLHLTGRALRD